MAELTRSTGRMSNIDILRAAAMTAVVAQHCDLFPFGWSGVWLFYVISGFVVTHSLDNLDVSASKAGKIIQFYWNRLFRICPPYYIFLLFAVIILYFSKSPPGTDVIWHACTFQLNEIMKSYHGLWFDDFPVSHLWTISVEMQFYFVAGVFLVLLSNFWRISLMILIITACPLARIWIDLHNMDFDFAHSAVLQADSFAAGSLLCLCKKYISRQKALIGLWLGAIAVFAFFAFYILYNYVALHVRGVALIKGIVSGHSVGQLRESVIYDVFIIMFSSIVAIAYKFENFNTRTGEYLSLLGRASYSGYLWHFAIIVFFRKILISCGLPINATLVGLPWKALLFLITMITLGPISIFMYRKIESPIFRKSKAIYNNISIPGVTVPRSAHARST